MRKSEKHKKQLSQFSNGIDYDTSIQMISDYKKGFYIDAHNMVLREDEQESGALTKIKGDSDGFSLQENTGGVCIGSCFVLGQLVEFFANPLGKSVIPYIRIDGIIMVQSTSLLLTYNHLLQIDTNESCTGGEVFVTDNYIEPFILNIGDIVDNYHNNTGKYFSGFDFSLYSINLKSPIDHPIFVQLEQSGIDGLDVGMYSYSIRYTDDSGNKTQWSVATPYIPVVIKQIDSTANEYADTYPYRQVYGQSPTTDSSYGIRIRFRCNNFGNYKYIEVKRVKQNTGQPLNYLSTPEYIKVITNDYTGQPLDILSVKHQVVEFVDDKSKTDWISITDTEVASESAIISRAKAIRYYDNRLVLANYQTPSRDVESDITFVELDSNTKLFPIVKPLGIYGHSDIYNSTYYKNSQTGEKCSYYIQLYDSNGIRTLVVPIEKNFVTPNRRTAMGSLSTEWCVTKGEGAVICADNDGIETNTFEVFDTVNSSGKDITSAVVCIGGSGVEFSALYPLKKNDDISATRAGLSYTPLLTTKAGGIEYSFGGLQSGFGRRYYSNGIAFSGIKSFPSWVAGFSVVRGDRANNVIAQGIATYNINVNNGTEKYLNSVCVYIPDDDAIELLPISNFTDNASDNFLLEIVSPLGFKTELYSGVSIENDPIDMISYADLLNNDGANNISINDGLLNYAGETQYNTKFGQWRNSITPTNSDFTSRIFSISSIAYRNDDRQGRGRYFIITLDNNIYATNSVSGFDPADIEQIQFHEPFYMVNILDKNGGDVVENNINYTKESGHLQKINSLICEATGDSMSIDLIDERWEDCIPININNTYTGYVDENRYIYVESIGGIQQAWINVTFKDNATVSTNNILDGLTLNGYYDVNDIDVDGNNIVVRVFGVYTHNQITNDKYSIVFNHTNILYGKQYFIPNIGSKIYVRYDNRIPIRVFTGDTYISNSLFAVVDGKMKNLTDGINLNTKNVTPDASTMINVTIPLPYFEYRFNQNYHQTYRVRGSLFENWNNVSKNSVFASVIRQWIISFVCETRHNSLFNYSQDDGVYQFFPQIHYIPRPSNFNPSDRSQNFDGDAIYSLYDTAYPNEWGSTNWWYYGGFRFKQIDGVDNHTYNPDYNKIPNDNDNNTKPSIGFTEQINFCTGILWSERRSVNEQDDPNLKTFSISNKYTTSDSQGEIKYLYDNNSDKGNNLVAITETGISVLLTNKTTLSDIIGNVNAIVNVNTGFIQSEQWLSKSIGSPDEMWRGIAEYNNKLFIPSHDNIYLLNGLQLNGIIKEYASTYNSKLYPILKSVTNATLLNSIYDQLHEEYVIIINDKSYIFKSIGDNSKWIGTADYKYDKMAFNKDDGYIYGNINGSTYKNTSSTYTWDSDNFNPVSSLVSIPVSQEGYLAKELIDILVTSNYKPDSIKFYLEKESTEQCELTSSVLRNYTNSYYSVIPRSVIGNRDRLQSQGFTVNILSTGANKFTLNSVETGYKILI